MWVCSGPTSSIKGTPPHGFGQATFLTSWVMTTLNRSQRGNYAWSGGIQVPVTTIQRDTCVLLL